MNYSTVQYSAVQCCIVQYAAVHCSIVQYSAVHCITLHYTAIYIAVYPTTARIYNCLLHCRVGTVYCSVVWQCNAMLCSISYCIVVHCSALQSIAVYFSILGKQKKGRRKKSRAMFSKMSQRLALPALTGRTAAEARRSFSLTPVRSISLTPGREFLKDSAKRVLATQESKAPPSAPDLPNFVDMRQGEKVKKWEREWRLALVMLRGRFTDSH